MIEGALLDGSPSAQDHGPDAIQFVGLGLPEEMAATTGARNPSTAVVTFLNETGT